MGGRVRGGGEENKSNNIGQHHAYYENAGKE